MTTPFPIVRAYMEHWDTTHAIRELIANAYDAETRDPYNKAVIKYYSRTEVLRITTENIKLSQDTLFLGKTGSRSYEDTIGQYGEGSLLAYLVLTRDGTPVRVVNDDEIWTWKFEKHKGSEEELLTLHTRKCKPTGNFTIEIPMDQEAWDLAATWFLRTDKRYDPKKTIQVAKEGYWKGGTILLQPELAHRVYIKGVYINSFPDMKYGYVLNDMQVNRDRNIVDSYTTQSELATLFDYAQQQHGNMGEFLFNLFTEKVEDEFGNEVVPLEVQDSWVFKNRKSLLEAIKEDYEARYPGCVPVTTVGEAKEMEFFGKASMIVIGAFAQTLTYAGIKPVEQVKKEAGLAATETIDRDDLSEAQRYNLDRAIYLVGAVMETDNLADRVNVVRFYEKDLWGRWGLLRGVELSIDIMDNQQKVLEVLVHEVAHDYADDGERAHGDKQLQILGQIIKWVTAERIVVEIGKSEPDPRYMNWIKPRMKELTRKVYEDSPLRVVNATKEEMLEQIETLERWRRLA